MHWYEKDLIYSIVNMTNSKSSAVAPLGIKLPWPQQHFPRRGLSWSDLETVNVSYAS